MSLQRFWKVSANSARDLKADQVVENQDTEVQSLSKNEWVLEMEEYTLTEFEQIADDVKKVKTRPEDQELLDLYGLYKQAVVGDINTEKPGILDMKGKAKWEAWNSRAGMSKDNAMTAYIALAKEVINKYGM